MKIFLKGECLSNLVLTCHKKEDCTTSGKGWEDELSRRAGGPEEQRSRMTPTFNNSQKDIKIFI